MLNNVIGFKNTIINKFGPVLGYAILIICALAVLSLLGFLFKTLIGILIGLAVASLVIFGAYKLYGLICTKKGS